MSKTLKFQWFIWSVTTFVITIGSILYMVSSKPTCFPLTLKNGTNVNVTLYRLHPHHLRLFLEFKQDIKNKRPELGDYSYSKDKDTLLFSNPGEPIKINVLISGAKEKIMLEAFPESAYSETKATREMIPYVERQDPHRFNSPNYTRLYLPKGISHIHFEVVEVGKNLMNENVLACIHAPVTFKGIAAGYESLATFTFWPIYIILLIIIGFILLLYSLKKP